MKYLLGKLLEEVVDKTTTNNQYPVLTSSKGGIFLQEEYFTKTVASRDNTGYKVIRRGQFTYRSMSDSGDFYINCLECVDVGIVSPAYPVFKIKDERIICKEYLIHFFKSTTFNKKISLLSKGSTRLSLKYKDLKNIEIEVPSMEKQKEVSLILNTIYELIKKCDKKMELSDELIRSRFDELFLDCDKDRLGNHCFTHARIGWQKLTKAEFLTSGDYYLVTGWDFDAENHVVNFDKCFFVTKDRYEQDPKLCLKTGDILLTKDGTLGKVAIINQLPKPATLNGHIFVIRSLDNNLIPEYLVGCFLSNAFREQIEQNKTGSTIAAITQATIREFEIPIPSKNLQEEYVVFYKKTSQMRLHAEEEKSRLNELLEIKMEEYFE